MAIASQRPRWLQLARMARRQILRTERARGAQFTDNRRYDAALAESRERKLPQSQAVHQAGSEFTAVRKRPPPRLARGDVRGDQTTLGPSHRMTPTSSLLAAMA